MHRSPALTTRLGALLLAFLVAATPATTVASCSGGKSDDDNGGAGGGSDSSLVMQWLGSNGSFDKIDVVRLRLHRLPRPLSSHFVERRSVPSHSAAGGDAASAWHRSRRSRAARSRSFAAAISAKAAPASSNRRPR